MAEQVPWLAALAAEDLAEFAGDIRDALNASVGARDAGPLERCLQEWRTTGEALSGPGRAVLTGAGDENYAEVERP